MGKRGSNRARGRASDRGWRALGDAAQGVRVVGRVVENVENVYRLDNIIGIQSLRTTIDEKRTLPLGLSGPTQCAVRL